MDIRPISPIEYQGWDEQISRLPGATFLHSAAWARVLHDAYGYTPLYFTIFDGAAVSACLPVMEVDSFLTGKRGVSLPFSDFCAPLVSGPDQFQELFELAVKYGIRNRWKSLELRGGADFLRGAPASSSYLTHSLDLSAVQLANEPISKSANQPSSSISQPSLPSLFSPSTKRNIRKASSSGLESQILTTKESVRQFCKLNQITRREHGLPPQPHRFFEKVYEHAISKGSGFVAAAFHEGVAIAASVYFYFGKTAIYKYGASDEAHQHLRPNNLVMWDAIKWCVDHGCDNLSFGRTDLDHDGLRRFKVGWGVAEQPLNYYRYDMGNRAFVAGDGARIRGIGNRAISLTPLPVLRAVGSLLYRHIG